MTPPSDSPTPTVDDILGATPGEAFALRATTGDRATILAGDIDALHTTDPDVAIADLRTDAAAYTQSDTPMHVAVLALDATTLWAIPAEEDAVVDKSERLCDRPPAQPHLGEPPQDPPACSISYRDDGRLGLTISTPISNGSRVKYYAPDDYGDVVAFTTGPLVDPRALLAADESPPTV